MTNEELLEKLRLLLEMIEELEDGFDKDMLLIDANNIRNVIDSMALNQIVNLMNQIDTSELSDIEQLTLVASNANKSHEERVTAFNSVFSFFKQLLDIAV